MSDTTSTDPFRGWRIVDAVVRLRALETGHVYDLPSPSSGDAILGSSSSCAIRIHDPMHTVSRRHARLVWHGALWSVRDLGSKNGLWVDGTRCEAADVIAGLELGIGSVTLLAESPALIELRAVMTRLVGWADRCRHEVDRAVLALRDAAARRVALVLCGDGDVVAIASRLHREALGADRAFVPCGGGRAAPLVDQARDGTLCLVARRPPHDLDAVVDRVRAPGATTRVTVCSPTIEQAAALAIRLAPVATVVVPALATRADELERMFGEYADEAARELEQPVTGITIDDLRWLSALPFAGPAEVEQAVRRLVAIRTLGVAQGAGRVGVSHGALSRWAKRRGL